MNHRDILKGKEVLDVSCGKGGSTNFLLHHLNAKRVVGIDFSKKQIEMCDDLFGQEEGDDVTREDKLSEPET